MRDLAIAYGNSRQAKKWVNKTVKFDALKARLKSTMYTTESVEEYRKMNKASRDAAKDHGGFVAGVLKGGRRKIDTVGKRSMVALDGDRITKEFLDDYENIIPYTSALYTTHSSTVDEPRVRLIFPLTRDVTSEEFVAVSRYLAQMLGIDMFDECSYQPNQLMYWPSTPANGTFVYRGLVLTVWWAIRLLLWRKTPSGLRLPRRNTVASSLRTGRLHQAYWSTRGRLRIRLRSGTRGRRHSVVAITRTRWLSSRRA